MVKLMAPSETSNVSRLTMKEARVETQLVWGRVNHQFATSVRKSAEQAAWKYGPDARISLKNRHI